MSEQNKYSTTPRDYNHVGQMPQTIATGKALGKVDPTSQSLARDIRNFAWAEDTQESIARFIEWCSILYNFTSDRNDYIDFSVGQMNTMFSDIVKEFSEEKDYHSLPEIAGARGGFDTLGERLDETTSQLAQTQSEKVDKNGVGQITWGNIGQDARENISGSKIAVVGKDGVIEENVVDRAITSRKRTVSGELALVTADNGSYVNFDFDNGVVSFVKVVNRVGRIARIRVHNRNNVYEIGDETTDYHLSFNPRETTRMTLTFNVVSRHVEIYTNNEVSQMTEDEVIIAGWISNDEGSIVSNINRLKINGKRDELVTINNLDEYLFGQLLNGKLKEKIPAKGRYKYGEDITYKLGEGAFNASFIEGKNIFNGLYANEYYVDGGIVEYPDNTRRVTNRIIANGGMTFTISGDHNRNTWIAFNSSDKQIDVFVGETYTCPADTYYVRCYYYNNADPDGNVQIEIGDSAMPFEIPYRKSIAEHNQLFTLKEHESLVVEYRNDLEIYDLNQVEEHANTAYGVRYNPNQSDPELERVGGSVGLTADISVDNAPITNDFDNIYPWSDMKVCNVSKTDWGATKITYKEDDDFAYDGSNGDVMVEIPKHYVRRYRENGYEYIMISGTPQDGFVLDPSFVENGKELDRIYVGRYNNFIENDIPKSITGTYPTTYTNLSTLLTMSENKGDGYSVLDFRTLSTLQRLFLVEFATRDSQSVMGGITKTVYHNKVDCRAIYSGTQVNKIIIQQGDQSDKFRVGQRCSVAIEQEFQDRHITEVNDLPSGEREIVFDGTPVDLIAGKTQICNIAQENGDSDHITYSSGRKAGDSDKVAFTYRGVENLYGNVHELIAGAFTKNGVVHLLENMSDYDTQDIESVSKKLSWQMPDIPYTGAYDATTPYIQEMGYDPLNPLVLLPSVGGTNTIGADYWSDEVNAPIQVYEQYCAFGGGWDHYERSGLFNYRFFINRGTNIVGWLHGSRLIYKNI